ncbi:DUF3558 family protein [Nocardia sp. NBC_00403]|uniref:DUF3558 family protein n=1 Tax=Nocardia sp. NBC_00403 TaxID=2975990 RepID=UPI002E1ABACE
MGIRHGRSVSALLALLLVIGVAGCSRGTMQQYKAGFSELPARCSGALKPAERAIKAFAGEAYSSVAESQDANRRVTDTSQHLTCAMKFGGSVLREPIKPYRTPMWRNVSISYFLSLYPIRANETPKNLMDYVPQAPSALPRTMLTQPSLTSSASTPPTTKASGRVWDPCEIPEDSLTVAGLDVKSQFRGDKQTSSAMCMWRGGWYRLRVFYQDAPFERSVYESSTYVRPKPVTIGDRHAVQVHWDNSDNWCVLAFEVPLEANLPDAGGPTLTFEASLTEDRSQTELCDELIRVTTAVAGAIPPTT